MGGTSLRTRPSAFCELREFFDPPNRDKKEEAANHLHRVGDLSVPPRTYSESRSENSRLFKVPLRREPFRERLPNSTLRFGKVFEFQ
jgi:hypothetical protein